MPVIVRNDRGKVLARIHRVGRYIDLAGIKRMTPAEFYKVAVEMAAFVGAQPAEPPADEDRRAAALRSSQGTEPPTHGPGSARSVWVHYAQSHGVEVTSAMSRGDIIRAVQQRVA